jgi:hypothetical protein
MAPGLHTGALSFGPTGRLAVTLTSIAPGAIPSVIVTGTVAIDPSAALNLVVAPGIAVPHGSKLLLIDNDASDAIGGRFTGVPTGSVLTTVDGVPLAVNYAGGDGNDLSLTAGNVPPQTSSISATPNPVAAGVQVTLSVAEFDANQDQLATTWNFGDGTTGTGAAASHTYTTPGRYTTVAIVSDGLAQVQSTTVITVTGTPAGGGGGGSASANVSGGVSVSGTTATVQLGCQGPAGSSCTVSGVLTSTQHLTGHKIVAVTAKKHRSKTTVNVGTKTVTIAAGSTTTLSVPLNGAGKSLLRNFGTLPTTLMLTSAGKTILSSRVTFKHRTAKKRKKALTYRSR